MKQKQKPVKAWALFTERGELAVISSTLPVFWHRKVAEKLSRHFDGQYEVRAVVVNAIGESHVR